MIERIFTINILGRTNGRFCVRRRTRRSPTGAVARRERREGVVEVGSTGKMMATRMIPRGLARPHLRRLRVALVAAKASRKNHWPAVKM